MYLTGKGRPREGDGGEEEKEGGRKRKWKRRGEKGEKGKNRVRGRVLSTLPVRSTAALLWFKPMGLVSAT